MTAAISTVCSAWSYPLRVESQFGNGWVADDVFNEGEEQDAKLRLEQRRRQHPDRKHRLIRMSFEEIE